MPFNVVAVVSDRIGEAAAGNNNSARLLVSVTDGKNAPVGGLAASHFKISLPSAATKVEFEGLDNLGVPGVYRFEVVRESVPWTKGHYYFAIQVKRTVRNVTHQGQTLTVFEIR